MDTLMKVLTYAMMYTMLIVGMSMVAGAILQRIGRRYPRVFPEVCAPLSVREAEEAQAAAEMEEARRRESIAESDAHADEARERFNALILRSDAKMRVAEARRLLREYIAKARARHQK